MILKQIIFTDLTTYYKRLDGLNNAITEIQELLSNKREISTCTNYKNTTIRPKMIPAIEDFTDRVQISKLKLHKATSVQTFDKYVYENQYEDQHISPEFNPEDDEFCETDEFIEFTDQGDMFHYTY